MREQQIIRHEMRGDIEDKMIMPTATAMAPREPEPLTSLLKNKGCGDIGIELFSESQAG